MFSTEKISPNLSGIIPTALLEQAVAIALKKLNLISREEFDVQTKVLLRTREKLEALEQKLALLEAKQMEHMGE